MIQLYAMSSPNVAKVMLALEELELPYALRWIDVLAGAQHAPEYRAVNPNGKAPALVDPDGPDGEPVTVWESGAILIYLAEKTGRFLPARSAERYQVLQWLMFQMGGVGPMFGQAIHFSAAVQDDSYGRRRFVNELHRLLDVLDARLAEQPFLAGERYSIADMAVFPWLDTAEGFFKDEMRRPALDAWREGIAARPATLRMQAKRDELAARDRAARRQATPQMWDRYFGRLARADDR